MNHEHPFKISSKDNPRFKSFLALQESRERRKSGLFLLEGLREIERALASGFRMNAFIVPDSEKGEEVWAEFQARVREQKADAYTFSNALFSKLVYRDEVKNAIAVMEMIKTPISELNLPENPLVVVLDGLEKPGNLGAILRSCDAAGVDAVLITRPQTDLYNPNLIRASLGCLFSLQVITATEEEVLEALKSRNIQVLSTYFDRAVNYCSIDYTKGAAVVMGGEAFGISDFWVDNADSLVMIPMNGIADSLNVSTSTAVILYEAVRQRSV